MKDGHYISIISASDEDADINFFALCTSLPGINLANGMLGNEILICVAESNSNPSYPLDRIREALERPARLDMFELATNHKSGEQYRNWYYLPYRGVKRKEGKGKAA